MSSKNKIFLVLLIIGIFSCRNKTEQNNLKNQNNIQGTHSINETKDAEYSSIPEINTVYPPDFSCDTCYWGICLNDSIQLVKEKLYENNIEFEEGIDYAGVLKIWNKGMIIEEGINQNFMVSFYGEELYAFTKENISLEDAKKICMHYEDQFDVSTLEKYQCHIIREDKYEFSLWNVGSCYSFSIKNLLMSKQLKKIYDSFES